MTRLALLFEGGLGAGALAIGWLVGHWPGIGMKWESQAVPGQLQAAGWGLLATLPMLAALMLIDRFPLGPLARLRDIAHELILQMFAGASVVQLAAVAVVAGLGEELLFRGLIQAGLSSGLSRLIPDPGGPWIALLVASVAFGVCHWLNTTYGVLSMLAGAYFGILLLVTGNLWTPIVAHAAYDFVALIYLVRPKRLIRSRV